MTGIRPSIYHPLISSQKYTGHQMIHPSSMHQVNTNNLGPITLATNHPMTFPSISIPLNHRIISPSSLSPQFITSLNILANLILSQSVLTRPVGTRSPGTEFVEAILAFAEYFFHVQCSRQTKDAGGIESLLVDESLSQSR